jgi:hypothetical protein
MEDHDDTAPEPSIKPTHKFLKEFIEHRDRAKQLLTSLNETAQHLFPQLDSGKYSNLDQEPAIYNALNELTKGLEDAVLEISILTSKQAAAIKAHGCTTPDSFHYEVSRQEKVE